MGLIDRAKSILTRVPVSAHTAHDSADAQALAAAPRAQYGGPGILTNLLSGLNTSEDAAWWDQWFQRRPLCEEERRVLGLDPLVRRILALPGDDATREGWDVVVDDPALPDRKTVSKTISDYEQRVGISLGAQLRDASLRSRQYGGALILLGIDDGRTPDQPVDKKKIKRIWWAKVVDWRDFDYGQVIGPRGELVGYGSLPESEQQKYQPGAERFGQVESFLVTDLNGVLPDGVRYGDGYTQSGSTATLLPSNVTFHSDRVLWLPYDEALPLLDQMQDALAAYFRGMSGVSRAIDRASLLIWKIANHVTQSWSENHGIGRARIRDAMKSWSALSAMVIDKDDEDLIFGGGGSTAGLDSAINPIMVWLSALSGIPVTVLWLVSPGGFGTGDSEREIWFDKVRAYRASKLTALVRKFAIYVIAAQDGLATAISPDSIEIEWGDLTPPTEAEKIDSLAKRADIAGKLGNLFLESELRKLFADDIELDTAARAAIAARELANRASAQASKNPVSSEAVAATMTLVKESGLPFTAGGARAILATFGVPPELALQIFPDPVEPPLAAPGVMPGETPETADGQGIDPVVDLPAPPPSRYIPPDALPAREIASEFGVPTRTITRMAEKELIKRYIRVGGLPVFSRSEVIEAERRGNMTAEEIEAEMEIERQAEELAAAEAEGEETEIENEVEVKNEVEIEFEDVIEKTGPAEWTLYSKNRTKKLGVFGSLEAAQEREREIERIKHAKESQAS